MGREFNAGNTRCLARSRCSDAGAGLHGCKLVVSTSGTMLYCTNLTRHRRTSTHTQEPDSLLDRTGPRSERALQLLREPPVLPLFLPRNLCSDPQTCEDGHLLIAWHSSPERDFHKHPLAALRHIRGTFGVVLGGQRVGVEDGELRRGVRERKTVLHHGRTRLNASCSSGGEFLQQDATTGWALFVPGCTGAGGLLTQMKPFIRLGVIFTILLHQRTYPKEQPGNNPLLPKVNRGSTFALRRPHSRRLSR